MSNPEIIGSALSGMGFVGAVISMLLMAIGAQATAIVLLYRRGNALQEERKEEIAGVIKVAESANGVLAKLADGADDRNLAIDGLADAIKAQAGVLELVTQRVDFHHGANIEKLKDLREVVASMADAVRVMTGVVTSSRESITATAQIGNELKLKVDAVHALVTSRGRPR